MCSTALVDFDTTCIMRNDKLELGLGKLFPKIHLLFYSFIPKFSAYYSLKPAHYS